MNSLLNEISIEIMPNLKLFSHLEGSFRNMYVDLIDSNDNIL